MRTSSKTIWIKIWEPFGWSHALAFCRGRSCSHLLLWIAYCRPSEQRTCSLSLESSHQQLGCERSFSLPRAGVPEWEQSYWKTGFDFFDSGLPEPLLLEGLLPQIDESPVLFVEDFPVVVVPHLLLVLFPEILAEADCVSEEVQLRGTLGVSEVHDLSTLKASMI